MAAKSKTNANVEVHMTHLDRVHVHQVEIHTQLSPPRAISPPHSGLGAQILANFPAPPGAVCFLGHVIKMVGVYAKAHKELIVRRDWPAVTFPLTLVHT